MKILPTMFAAFLLTMTASPAAADSGSHEFGWGMEPVLADYIAIQEALAGDSLEGVPATATSISESAAKLDSEGITGEHAEHYKSVSAALVSASDELAKAQTIEEARAAFKGLSRPMSMWAAMSKPAEINVVFCSMADATWLQKAGDIKNPYYGSSMLGCGEVVATATD